MNKLPEYRRGDIAWLRELANGWLFYSGYYQLPETERALSATQAGEYLCAAFGGKERD